MLTGFRRTIKPFQILTDEQILDIHAGTLSILRGTGVKVEHEVSLKLLKEHGCEVDFAEQMVRFPPGLIEECLRKCPSTFRVKARDSKKDVIFGGNNLYFKNSVGQLTIDIDTMEPLMPTENEFNDAMTILAALDNHHILGPYTPYFGYEGLPPVIAMPTTCATKIKYSPKVQLEGYAKGSEKFSIKMAKVVNSEIIGLMLSASPLTWGAEAIEAGFRYINADFPIVITSGTTMGGTAPATIAGSLVATNSELLPSVVLTQLEKPGAKLIAGTFTFPMEMRSGLPAFGDVGVSLYHLAFNQMWREFYRFPVYNSASGYCSSKTMDFQAGYEKMLACSMSALSGANLITLHGSVSAELTYHPIQSILDDDIAGIIGRLVEGFEVNEETLALDLIEKVGPIPGTFLALAHTRKWWKKEQFLPKAADRLSYPEWVEKSKKMCIDYAKERVEEILSTFSPTPLPQDQENELNEILEEARQYYKETGQI